MTIEEASAKVRSGPPIDDEPDYALPVWAGVIPIRQIFGAAIPDPRLAPGTAWPKHLGSFVDGARLDVVLTSMSNTKA
jgi:hypothetical protein